MRKILSIITVLYPELFITTTTIALAAGMLKDALDRHELNDNETFILNIYKDDVQIKKILRPNKYPRYGFKEIRRLDKLVGVRLYSRAVPWLLKILEYL